jgi:hypothetical protein
MADGQALLDPIRRASYKRQMPKSLLRFGQYLLIAAMFAACGGHWLILQSMAWGGMMVEYSRTAGLTVAVEKTFDGQHPCGLCKVIQKSKGSEPKRDLQVIVSKLELFYTAAPVLVLPVWKSWTPSVMDCFSEARMESPSVPPPRFA